MQTGIVTANYQWASPWVISAMYRGELAISKYYMLERKLVQLSRQKFTALRKAMNFLYLKLNSL